jgi:[acyl-carrier-protein] S-malonyltransferase
VRVTATEVPERTALVFAGQGSHRAGMGSAWRDLEAWAVVDVVAEWSGADVEELLTTTDNESLRRTDRAQLATFAMQMIALRQVDETSSRSYVAAAGHSVGEYAALVAAGVLDVGPASRLVAARGAAMRDAAAAVPGTMVALVGAPVADVGEEVDRLRSGGASVWVANINSPEQVSVAGDHGGIELVRGAATAFGAKAIDLPVGGAFHCPLMAPAAAALESALAAVPFHDAAVPVVANVDGRARSTGDEWRALLVRQLTSPVLWVDVVRTLTAELSCRRMVDAGPGTTLSGLVRRIAGDVDCGPVRPAVSTVRAPVG